MNSSYKNRGMFLENIINDSNTYYNSIDKCLIYKKPTPIKVLNVSYPTNRSHIIDKVTDGDRNQNRGSLRKEADEKGGRQLSGVAVMSIT